MERIILKISNVGNEFENTGSRHIRLLIGGSPCTHWSIAQKNNRETEPNGLGWELFKNFLIAKEKFKPDYFLYENNKSAAQPIKDQISKELGVPLQYINSALVSAQNRQRFYAHNIPNVPQPEDRGILLKDILESGMDLSQNEKAYALNDINGKARTIRATCYKDGIRNLVGNNIDRKTCVAEPIRIGTIESGERSLKSDSQANRVYSPYAKSGLYACPIEPIFDSEVVKEKYCKFADKKGYIPELFNPYNMAEINNKAPTQTAMCDRINSSATVLKFEKSADCKQHPVYEVKNGLITIKDKQYPIKLPDGYYIIRKLTVLECKRLQTVRDNYIMPCSASQNYKMLGNGWTVDVIAHILSHIPDIENCEVEVLSMYDGMSCGNLALEKLGCKINKYISYEIDKYAIQTTQTNFPYVIQKGDAFQVRNYNWKY